jgi:hypothetical protein
VGDQLTGDLTAGPTDRADFCDVVAGGRPDTRLPGHWWHVGVGVRAIEVDRVRLDLTWATAGPSGLREARDPRAVVVPTGEAYVLDLVHAPTDSPAPCANVLVRVRTEPVPAPAVTTPWLTYDLWLVLDGPHGRQTVRHTRVQAAAGEAAPFALAPVRWSLRGTRLARVDPTGLALTVRGTLRGPLRMDDTLAIEIALQRDVAFGEHATGGRGHLACVAHIGETVELAIPPPGGTLTGPAGRGPWGPGVVVTGDTATVDLATFFGATRWALLVRVSEVSEEIG